MTRPKPATSVWWSWRSCCQKARRHSHKICCFKANRHRTNRICHHRRHFRQPQFNHITEPHQVNASDGCSVAPKPVGTLQFGQQSPGYIFFASEKLFEGAGLFLLHSPCECLRHGTFLLFFVFVGQSVFPPSRHRHKRSASLRACSKDAAAARTAGFAASADTILSACLNCHICNTKTIIH